MSLPSQSDNQQSQKNKSYENFCMQFCVQVEKNSTEFEGDSSKFVSQITKVFSQLNGEHRWVTFCTFARKRCQIDGGEMISRFVKNWFVALRQLDDQFLHVLRMYELILELIDIEELSTDPSIALHSHLSKELEMFEPQLLVQLCGSVREVFITGSMIKKRWLGACAIIFYYISNKVQSVVVDQKAVNGGQYRDYFLLKLLDDIVVTESYEAAVILIGDCSADEILEKHVRCLLELDANLEIITKIIISSANLCCEVIELVLDYLFKKVNLPLVDLYPICLRLHSLYDSSPVFAKTTLNAMKRDQCLITSRIFALVSILSLCNISRFRQCALVELKKLIAKLRKHHQRVEESLWMQSIVQNCETQYLKNNLEKLLSLVAKDIRWSVIVGEGLKSMAFSIISDKCRADLKIVDGRVEDDGGITNWPKRIILALAENSKSINDLLSRIFFALTVNIERTSSAILIDMIIEIVLQHPVHLLNSWKSLHKLIDSICSLKEELAVWLVRALLPIIVQRSQLVSAIVLQMRRSVLNEKSVATALPILLLILRSSSIRSSTKNDLFSQSFATFSTQALQAVGVSVRGGNTEVAIEVTAILKRMLSQPTSTKVVLYRGIIEASYANENLVAPVLDMLFLHFITLPTMSRKSYVESSKTSTVLFEPLPELIQSISILARLSIQCTTRTSTQIPGGRESQITDVIGHLNRFLAFALENDAHYLEIDKLADFSSSATGRSNIVFARMMVDVYDAFVEHLWHVGNVLAEIENAEKISKLLRLRSEICEILKEKSVKRKDSKGIFNASSVSQCGNFHIQLHTVTSVLSRFIRKACEEDVKDSENCVELLRSALVDWALDWADRMAPDFAQYASNASLFSLTSFGKNMLLLYVGNDLVNEAIVTPLWSRRCTTAIVSFSSCLSHVLSKYSCSSALSRIQAAALEIWQHVSKNAVTSGSGTLNTATLRLLRFLMVERLPKVFDQHEDFMERKLTGDFSRQATAILATGRVLLNTLRFSAEKIQLFCFKLFMNLIYKYRIVEKSILREVWNSLIYVARRGTCDAHYTKFLRLVAKQLIEILENEHTSNGQNRMESIRESTLETTAEMLINACSLSLSDIRLLSDVISPCSDMKLVDDGLCSAINFTTRITEIILTILPVHIQHGMLREQISSLLGSLYNTMDVIVVFLRSKQNSCDISGWEILGRLAALARSSLLRVMEIADEHVGTLNPLDQPAMKHQRKCAKALKDETVYVTYVRMREQYQTNLLLLSSALRDDRLNIQVRNNAIGARDFRIDTEMLKQRMEELCGDENPDEYDGQTQPPIAKKRRNEVC